MNREIKCLGKVRGGCNNYARIHLHIIPIDIENMSEEELKAMLCLWEEEFGLKGVIWEGMCFSINNRREFALVPTIIRRAEKLGCDVALSEWDEGLKSLCKLSEHPVLFWKTLACQQMWMNS